MKKFYIRNALFSDIQQLVFLRKLFLYEKYGTKDVENDSILQLQIQKYFMEHIDKDVDIVVAEANEDIIGVFCVSYLQLLPGMNPDSERSAYLLFDYIKPDFRIKGIREKILEYSMVKAKEKKATVFEVEVIESEFSQYEKEGFIKSPFPLVRFHISDESNFTYMTVKDANISFRKADITDISDLIELRVKFLAEVLSKEENSIKKEIYGRLKVYVEEYLNKRLEVFLAENDKEILGAIFVIYYERVPEIQIENGKVGVPVNFFIQSGYKNSNLPKCLFDFSAQCAFEKEVRLFEMAIPKKSERFYGELGFEKMELIPVQAYINNSI